jgi:pimeloyl-ACP methyl ester carboxylesterase
VLVALLAGCASDLSTPRVIFLDGAGWYTGDGPVRAGLQKAGFNGPVERFGWASGLGPLHDHLVVGPSHPRTGALAERITQLRQANPNGKIVLMGLSAGSRVVVCGLEKLPPTVAVDHVVLLSPSISSRHDLGKALRHVKGRLYFTTSKQDGILSTACSAGMEGGRPAGQAGFVLPDHPTTQTKDLYRKVVPLPWRPGYLAYGWDGGHVSATSSDFIRVVIAPRIIDDSPHPLDQALVSAHAGVR